MTHLRRRWCRVALPIAVAAGLVGVQTTAGLSSVAVSHLSCSSSSPMQLAYGDGTGIVIVDTTGTVLLRLTHPPRDWSDGDPSWSPDGKRLAFARFNVPNPGGVDLYVVRASNGSRPKMLTYALAPSWSPRGGALLVTRTNGHDFWPAIIDVDRPTREIDLARAGSWSPDGRVTFAGGGDLVIADSTGAHGKRIWRGHAVAPAWSPDGTRIAFVATSDRLHRRAGLWVVNADGTRPRLIVRAHQPESPAWSPDGRRVAFVDVLGGRRTLEVVDPQGRGRTIIQRNGPSDPTWSPDGKWLAYTATPIRFTSRVYVVRPDGTRLHALPGAFSLASTLAWRPCTS